MNGLTPEQGLPIVQIYYQNNGSVRATRRYEADFSDEPHFWLNGYVNKQNCRYWRDDNPQAIAETPLHPQKVTVWCALWAEGIIGPHFFKNEAGHNVTGNGERYRALINDFFAPELEDVDQFIEGNFWWAHYLASRACGVASKFMRYNTAGLFSVGFCEVACLRR